MARIRKQAFRPPQGEIDVADLEGISVRFPGDVYMLATWIAMADQAKSKPTTQSHTTLHGLAQNFAMLYGADHSNPLNTEDVMAVLRKHGISGNPLLRLDTTQAAGEDKSGTS